MNIYTFAGKNDMTIFANAEAVESFMGKDAAKGLIDGVDFSKEKIVLVSWITTGPPDGSLQYEVNKGVIEFYMQSPGNVRRERLATYGAVSLPCRAMPRWCSIARSGSIRRQ